MARRFLGILAVLVVTTALLAAVVLAAHAKAESHLGYAVLKLIAGETPRAPAGAMLAPVMAAGQRVSGHACGGGDSCSTHGGGSCSMGAEESCDSEGSCVTEAGGEEAIPMKGEQQEAGTADQSSEGETAPAA